eukprot:9468557-Pyramimonas_sp.AAC.1
MRRLHNEAVVPSYRLIVWWGPVSRYRLIVGCYGVIVVVMVMMLVTNKMMVMAIMVCVSMNVENVEKACAVHR